jgi:hypothetical protein
MSLSSNKSSLAWHEMGAGSILRRFGLAWTGSAAVAADDAAAGTSGVTSMARSAAPTPLIGKVFGRPHDGATISSTHRPARSPGLLPRLALSSPRLAVQEDGLRYDVGVYSGLSVRVYASVFGGLLDAQVRLTNTSTETVLLTSPQLVVSDTRGVALPQRIVYKPNCPSRAGTIEVAPAGGCKLVTDFQIQPFVQGFIWPRDNPDLARITVKVIFSQPAPTQNIVIPMEWMK